MKKLWILYFISLTVTMVATAQEYKKFKLGVGIGVANYQGGKYNPNGSLILATVEPAYRIHDNIAIGLRIEGAGWYGHFSLTANGQYYFGKNIVRPFVGAGLGMFQKGSANSSFGFYPRVGLEVGHFFVSMDYNFISAVNPNGDEITSYLGSRIGFLIGGGRK